VADVYRMVINGNTVDARTGATFEVRNPADTAEVVGQAPLGDREDVTAAIRAAAEAVATSWWSRLHESARRAAVMRRFVSLVDANRSTLARLLTLEQGKPYREAMGEVEGVVEAFDFYAGYASGLGGATHSTRVGDAVVRIETRKQPIGLCAAILPFNFPAGQYAWKVAPALITGNAVVVKPASSTPLVDIRLTELLQEAGAPPGIVSIVTGPSHVVGEELIRSPQVRRIAFTGSTEVGRLIATAGAPAFKRVTLELGGSDPAVVADDADLELAAKSIVRYGRFINAGQSCISVKRLFVFEPVFNRFVELLVREAAGIRVGNGLVADTDMGPLNNAATLADVERLLSDAKDRGATVATGGQRLHEGVHARGYFLEPTILIDVPEDAAVWREECFGPVLPVKPVSGLEEAVAKANNTRFGLGASIWSRSRRTIERFIQQIESGMVWINHHPIAPLDAPFGGVKDSGIGRELAGEGLAEYVETKSIYQRAAA
jgi:acyl-CoA reductase-like NAD-dependent aldehyde dehydrogenase